MTQFLKSDKIEGKKEGRGERRKSAGKEKTLEANGRRPNSTFAPRSKVCLVSALTPKTIINYSYTPDEIFKSYEKAGLEIIKIENYLLTVRKKAKA